ncbi:MAG: VCBS repeat-containing protein, partial [Planctomycetes bacterium]|nr:VCBS repeat-containing protein [Planctomycetota bacterium]
NMDGDRNGLFRNNGRRFTDVAARAGVDSGGRPVGLATYGSVRPCLGDYDNDGNLDIFVANYGPNALFKNQGRGRFVNVAGELGLAIDNCYDTGTWGDYDNDGLCDLYVNGTITRGTSFKDTLFHNDGDKFTNITPQILLNQNADHGAHWVDFDRDGDLDLSLTGAGDDGMHYLVRNTLAAEKAGRSIQVLVLNEKGHF